MNEDAERAIQRVAGLIEAYLTRHPAAADSERGIAQWWCADEPEEVVRLALDLLVTRGALARTWLPGGPAIYRAAKTDGGPAVEQNGTARQ